MVRVITVPYQLLYLLWEPALVLGPVMVLLFPDGRLPSARWRWELWTYLTVGPVLLAILVFNSAEAIAHRQSEVNGALTDASAQASH